ncbi:TetR/AcrR family transcriptional regulator [Streptomyces sp. NPDC056105]|uniref:TetR/AcrR family transcriptional regulator n=1 Tax=Streptomyces sp. NPDC056105 TaxID=3345714 RepID=UPI0035DD966D
MRGLPHRAVDKAADMSAGTTSAYCRTRQALLTALVRRLVERDQAELHAAGKELPPLRDADQLAPLIVEFVERRLTGEGRRRSLARYACAVESVRHPELRDILVPRENAARDAVRAFLAAHGVADAEDRTLTLLACVDGLVVDRLLSGGRVSEKEIRGARRDGSAVAPVRRGSPGCARGRSGAVPRGRAVRVGHRGGLHSGRAVRRGSPGCARGRSGAVPRGRAVRVGHRGGLRPGRAVAARDGRSAGWGAGSLTSS